MAKLVVVENQMHLTSKYLEDKKESFKRLLDGYKTWEEIEKEVGTEEMLKRKAASKHMFGPPQNFIVAIVKRWFI